MIADAFVIAILIALNERGKVQVSDTMFYNSFHEAMMRRFGCKVYKLALDGGFTCPTRDGTLGTRGCIFCSARGSGDFSEPAAQIELAKSRVADKVKTGKYIAYFQNFTNTYAPVSRLREVFSPVMALPEIVALDIATRPDCLEPEKVAFLQELNQKKPVWVELGLQTVNEKTADYIRRGFHLAVFDDAVKRLKAAGLEVIVHMIIGLPGDTEEDIYKTASYISDSGADGIKLQLLHVLKDTDLYQEYIAGKFQTLSLPEYIHLLEGCIQRLRPEIVIHRMTGDGPKKDLAAPLWSGDKKRVLNAIRAAFQQDQIVQGSMNH